MIRETSLEELSAFLTRDSNKVHLCWMAGRIGANALIAAIEWTWFLPNTSSNELYDIHATKFLDQPFLICSFPAIKLREAQHLARMLGMRLADGVPTFLTKTRDDGVPILVGISSRPSRRSTVEVQGFRASFFPGALLLDGKDNLAMLTIENDKDSPVYKNRLKDEKDMRSAEGEIVDLLNRGVVLTPPQISDYIYGTGPFPNLE